MRENVKLTRIDSNLHFESNEEECSAERSKVANKQIRCMFMEKLMYTERGEKLIRLVVRFLTNYYLGK